MIENTDILISIIIIIIFFFFGGGGGNHYQSPSCAVKVERIYMPAVQGLSFEMQ